MTELRTILLKNGMIRKWAANVKDRFDPLTEEHVLIDRYRIPGGSEMEVFITSRIPFVNMIGTGLDMGYMKPQLLEHKLNHYGYFRPLFQQRVHLHLLHRRGAPGPHPTKRFSTNKIEHNEKNRME